MLTQRAQAAMINYYQSVAKRNGTSFQMGASFTVSPSIQQKFLTELQKMTDLTRRIQMRVVTQRKSQTVTFSLSLGVTTRNDQTFKNRADNKLRDYETANRKFRYVIPWTDIDGWAGTNNLKKMLPGLYAQLQTKEMLYIALRGEERHENPSSFYDEDDPGAQLRKVDRGWSAVLAEKNPDNIISEWEPGTGVIIYGKTRIIPITGIQTTSESGGAKTGIPISQHGFVTGGLIHFENQPEYSDQDYTVEFDTTQEKIVINKSYTDTTFGSNAVLVQKPDFANIGELIVAGKRYVPDGKRDGLEAWIGDDIAAAYEMKIYGSADPTTPSEFQWMSKILASHGGLSCYEIVDFRQSEIWVLNPKTLGIYELNGSRRREAKENHDEDGYTDSTYVEQDNTIEDPERFLVLQNLRQLEAY